MKSYRALVLTLFIGLTTAVMAILPMIKSGPAAVFYTIDPDVQYLSNSLSYVAMGKIQYDVHPGTPTIMLHAFVLWPLRLYAKLVARIPFMTWVFENISLTYFYVRIFQALWLGVGVTLFLSAVYRVTESIVVLLPAWFGLMTYTVFPYFGSTIVPETTSFVLVSIWLLVLARHQKIIPIRVYLTLSIIAGLAVANKFSNLALVPATIAMVGLVPRIKLRRRIFLSGISFLTVIATFFIATWPIKNTYLNLWRWVSVLASTTGTHGGGKKAFFNLAAFNVSFSSLVHREWWPSLIMTIGLLLLTAMILRRKIGLRSPVSIIGFIAFGSALVFAKFPLSHYQVANYSLMVFVSAILLCRLPRGFTVVVLILLLPAVSANLANYGQLSLKMMANAAKLESFVAEHPAVKGTLWEWSRNKDFSFLWSRDWAHGIFDKELGLYRPDLLAITPDMKGVKINNRETKPVFGVCWDKFYVQTVSAPAFIAKYSDRKLTYVALPDIDDIGLIESDHCRND